MDALAALKTASETYATLPVAEALVREVEDAELFLYPGSGHLFADSSLDDYDEKARYLATRFKENFEKFGADENLVNAGPRV